MQRNMDTIRKIVLAVRDAPGVVNSVDGVSADEFAHHVQLLDAGRREERIDHFGKKINEISTGAYTYG